MDLNDLITPSLILGGGIALAGYFIGAGLRNFNNPDDFIFTDENDDHQLISESEVHNYLGIKKDDAKALLYQYPDIPHIKLNGTIYFPEKQLNKWVQNIEISS
ncbi:MerR family transcriptional regulator [Numidum massiliense]|uniref:hypothetical protein n=1 Tax=Numidum massiliense TaxID=1522315 RepID=UPI0006D54808|nr:hypothetical protein [Numidum massiliense]